MYFNFIRKSIFYTEFILESVPQLVILFGEHVIQTADKFFKNYAHRVQIDVLLR